MREKIRNPFKLRDFLGVNQEWIARLEALGIKTSDQMLRAGASPEMRAALAEKTGIPVEGILELVKLSDLARLPGVKGIRARLYYAAGVDCVEKLASWEPEALRLMATRYVESTGFPGIPPLPREVSSTVTNARQLPRVVEF